MFYLLKSLLLLILVISKLKCNNLIFSEIRFVENHPIRILEDGPLISEVVLSQIDDTLHEVDTGVGDNNFDDVFDGDEHDTAADDDDLDYQELLCHVKPHVLSSMGT
jgi:hypothetical protein